MRKFRPSSRSTPLQNASSCKKKNITIYQRPSKLLTVTLYYDVFDIEGRWSGVGWKHCNNL